MNPPATGRVGVFVDVRAAWVAAVAAIVVLGSGGAAPWVVVAAAVALAVAWAVDVARCVDPRVVPSVSRHVPAVVGVGEDLEVGWTVLHRGTRALRVRLVDHPAPALALEARSVTLRLAPGAPVTASVHGTVRRRGRHRLQGLAVRSWGPWGLGGRQALRPLDDEVRVSPGVLSRRAALARLDDARLLDVGVRSVRARGAGEFETLREYRPGDDVRHLDWPATSRAGHAVVRTYRAERDQPVLALLDCGRTMAANVDGAPRLDWALDALLGLAAVVERVGDRLGVVAYDASVRAVVPPSSRLDVAGLARVLADLQPSLSESDHRRAFAEALGRFGRRALFIVFTELSPGSVDETLVPALPLVTRRHLVTVASVRDLVVDDWPDRAPEDLGAVHRQAAAVTTLDRRRRLTARLSAAGATVVDEPAERLAGRLADHYLDAKVTGAL